MRLRITLVGASASGKSCLIKRYCEKRFVSRYLPTIGIDYGATKIYVDAREVSVHIFDTSGSPLFKEVRNEFYRDAHGILLVFDASSRSSFDALCQWTKEVYATLAREGKNFAEILLVVCANKSDLPRQVDEVEARLWAELRGYPYFETSALSGQGINDMFHAFFSLAVKAQEGRSRAATPTSARRVQLTKSQSGTSMTMPRKHAAGSAAADKILPEPSAEQKIVIQQLREGTDAWKQLGLQRGCSKEDVNKVYRRLAVLLHPDKTTVRGADEAFKLLGVARRDILRTMGVMA